MSIVGAPTDWSNLIDPLVPDILRLVIASWEGMRPPAPDAREDDISVELYRALQQNRTARGLMFQIGTQQVELDPAPGQDVGRMDITFRPLVPREDIYFCLECKRLNVNKDGVLRAYAAEYVTFGMLRFVTGQYANAVQHGGMIGYVLDGNVARAMANVESNLQTQHVVLRMTAPGAFQRSSILTRDDRARETHHGRDHQTTLFCVHHLFMARDVNLPDQPRPRRVSQPGQGAKGQRRRGRND
jgi:hypothetical protein